MSRAFSSKKAASSLPPPPAPTTKVAKPCSSKKRRSPRSPLQNLNRVSGSSNRSDGSSTVSSIEPPKGCLRFLSSSSYKTPVHRPKNISKTPSSGANETALERSKSKSSKENLPKGSNAGLPMKKLVSDKARVNKKNPPCLYQWQSGKKSGSRTGQKSKPLDENGKFLPTLPSASKELKEKGKGKEKEDILGRINDNAGNGEVEENSDTSICRTPPIHNSVSPEIQCVSTTPACYGAGYIVSGVTDKRKCRPRGILTVEENCSEFAKMTADSFDDDEKKIIIDAINEASPTLLPLPTEALVRWLSSPCKKEKKILKSENGLNQSQGLAESTSLDSGTSPSSSSKTFWNVSDSSDLSGAANGTWSKMSSSVSPSRLSKFQVAFDSIAPPSYPSIMLSPNSTPSCRAFSSAKGKSDQHRLNDDNSPFSLNSVGSRNVIQTPQSDSSSDLPVGLSLVSAYNGKEDSSNPELNSFSEILQSENLLLKSSMPLEDSVNSSFQFDCLTVPYESIDLSKLRKLLDDPDPWLSSSTMESASQSQMRISWREGSMSQLFDWDEFDCCRCLSDEEDLGNDRGSNRLASTQTEDNADGSGKLNCDVGLSETEGNELEIDGHDKEMLPSLLSCSGAESISTDGGGLAASRDDDSDWRLYGT
ncbi:uncharacterized protein LOC130718532 isoform X2 [Lotus japonicus]|uniref:uncharacterized protein LOC130718532 isoform X2 n=1 Tax=Lotus japonicus TaxID=34305 RepID=UPI00258D464A|nr:uncharacterized protein LOC130718532 isoform X2 [Lotus japonicus]